MKSPKPTPRKPRLPPPIKCKACDEASKHCEICGGFRYVFSWTRCPTCKNVRLERPGVHSTYEGKQYRSIDGVLVRVHLKKPWECSLCP